MSGQEFHIPVEENGEEIISLLEKQTGLGSEIIRDAFIKGALWQGLKGKPKRLRDMEAKTIAGSTLFFNFNPKVLAEVPLPARLIEDLNDYSIWYKPFGMLSQGSRWSDHCTIYRWAEQHLEPLKPAFIVHRLDRAATGLILLAHTNKAAAKLAALFQQRQIDKRYSCIVHGKYPAKPEQRKIDLAIDDKPAISFVRRMEFDPETKRSLLEVSIDTGRKHQIRRHLSATGFPVVGDRLYGREGDSEDLQLTATQLSFICPLDGTMRAFKLPDDLVPKLTIKQ